MRRHGPSLRPRPGARPERVSSPPVRSDEVRFEGQGGVVLRGDAWGPPGAMPVVLLHGGGQTRHSWGGTGRALAARGYRAMALDLRGHGDSDWSPDGRYGGEVFVRDLRDVAAALPRAPAVVGASLGGLAALLAEGESERSVTAAVVLVDVTPRLEVAGVLRILDFMTGRPEGFASLEEAADAVAAYLPSRRRPRDLAGLEKNLRRRADGRWRWHWDPRFVEGAERAQGPPEAYDPGRLLRAARGLRVPTLLVRGRVSDVVSPEGVDEFRAAAPHARFADVSGAGHMVAGDRNDAFTDAVVEFLTQAVPPTPA